MAGRAGGPGMAFSDGDRRRPPCRSGCVAIAAVASGRAQLDMLMAVYCAMPEAVTAKATVPA